MGTTPDSTQPAGAVTTVACDGVLLLLLVIFYPGLILLLGFVATLRLNTEESRSGLLYLDLYKYI